MAINLFDHQLEAIKKLKNGSILVGGVGSGKSRTAIGYYFKKFGGNFDPNYKDMTEKPADLYIITTARKRDTLEWESELAIFRLSTDEKTNFYKNKVVVDSWNNIKKYENVENAFFIFDEQRVVGSGAWAKAFMKLSKKNLWILLSATPGDTWMDYGPVFVANGFYKNLTEFRRRHVVWSRIARFPKVDHYVECDILEKNREKILVYMPFKRKTKCHEETIFVDFDKKTYSFVKNKRFDPFKGEPCRDAGAVCTLLRRIVNGGDARMAAILRIFADHPKIIVFYNYDYELEVLRSGLSDAKIPFSEWNGHKHEPILRSDEWIYLVQYTAGAEGWNCTETDTMIFYSYTYSHKALEQAKGRIDRLTTPFSDLYYYFLRTNSSIDSAIWNCLAMKKDFNERAFANFSEF